MSRTKDKRETPITITVDRRELATILAALRFHQDENLQGGGEITDMVIADIATDGGTLKPLDFPAVDRLCQRLNLGDTEGISNEAKPRWQCPQCRRIVRGSNQSLAEAGTPFCPDCDQHMHLL